MIRRAQALSGFTGRKEMRRRFDKSMLKPELNLGKALNTVGIEIERGEGNSWWSGEMR